MGVQIIEADARDALRTLPDGSVNCCVTSPPYWGLRDYGIEGQLGLEATPEEYVAKMVEIFREVRRVLRDDGTFWLNLGDTYATGAGKVCACPGGGKQGERWKEKYFGKQAHNGNPAAAGKTQPNRMPIPGLKPKDLVGIPWRVALALQGDGWWLRSDIIWHKPNPLTESVRDRPTKAHEYIFLLSKSKHYYYDSEAIAEPQVEDERHRRLKEQEKGLKSKYRLKRDGNTGVRDQGATGCARSVEARQKLAEKGTRNKRSVWNVPTHAYPSAHFATFPPALILPCILAGCPPGGTALDPFAGTGTVGEVAAGNSRNAILIELNPDYVKLAYNRVGLFSQMHDPVRIPPVAVDDSEILG